MIKYVYYAEKKCKRKRTSDKLNLIAEPMTTTTIVPTIRYEVSVILFFFGTENRNLIKKNRHTFDRTKVNGSLRRLIKKENKTKNVREILPYGCVGAAVFIPRI